LSKISGKESLRLENKRDQRAHEGGKALDFTEDAQGTIWFKKRICVPNIESIRETILREAHDSAYSINPRSTKMYQDLKYGMKRDVEH
jgi:hypothetical protein